MDYTIIALAAITGLFGVLRFTLPVEGKLDKKNIFKTLAHLFVGGLFGVWFATWEQWYGVLAIGLTALEVVAFVVRKKRP